MVNGESLFVKSLKEQVYEYLKDKIQNGDIGAGESISLEKTSKLLGISRTPLRDALLQLEFEGFVIIKPRKGIIVNPLTLADIEEYYQIIGALEASAINSLSGKFNKKDIKNLRQINNKMINAIEKADFDTYYKYNLDFHNYFLIRAENKELKKIIEIKKRRLYDFKRKNNFLKEWENESVKEHKNIIDLIEDNDYKAVADYMCNIHWSFVVQKKFILKYYNEK